MQKHLLFLAFAVLLTTFGCGPSATEDGAQVKSEPGKTVSEEATDKDSAPKLADLNPDLKHSAYYYFGLDNPEVMDLEVTQGKADSITGGQKVTLSEVKGDIALFAVERTGGLSVLKNAVIELRKDGVYTASNEGTDLKTPTLEIPADLEPGKTWKTDLNFSTQGEKFVLKANGRVIGLRKVKTPRAEYDALLVKNVATGTVNNVPITMTTMTYYVKDRGSVKVEVSQQKRGSPETRMVIQEAK